jgi:hypothetical protein
MLVDKEKIESITITTSLSPPVQEKKDALNKIFEYYGDPSKYFEQITDDYYFKKDLK